MRWTTAWLLALAAHVAVVVLVWFCCRTIAPKSPIADVVELAVLEPPQRPRAEPLRAPSRREVSAPRPEPKHEHAHATEHAHVREHEHEYEHAREHEHAHEHEHEHEHAQADEPKPAPTPEPAHAVAPAPINLNLTPKSLASLAPPPAASTSTPAGTTDTATLHGTIAGDGTIHIRSKSPVTVGSDLTSPGTVLKDWLKDPKAHAADHDGTVAIVKGTFDITDSIMRAVGQDPYRAKRMKMLDETREQRLTLAVRDRTERRGAELTALPRQLRNIWNDATRPVKQRRQIIFQLWDECQEPDEGEAEGAAAGAHARREIVLFIRERLAEGSPDAYPKEEITALNVARQSRQRFDPYGRSPL